MDEMKKLFDITKELREIDKKYCSLSWSLYTTGFDFGMQETYSEYLELLKNKDSWNTILRLKDTDLEPLDKRRVDIMENIFRPFNLTDRLNELSLRIQEMETKLSSVLNTHRNTIDGRQVTSPEISKILSTESNREIRKKAYLARTQVNKPLVEAGFIELIDLRKEYAAEYGSCSFVKYQLEQQELDHGIFDTWAEQISDILPLMKKIRSQLSEEIIGDPDPKPWDNSFIASGIAPELNRYIDMSGFFGPINNLFRMLGFDISEMNITYDIFPRKNKSEWGYNFPIDKGVDSRILANVRDRFFEFGVLLHETGHALHSFICNPEEVILNMGISGIVSEGIANLFGGYRGRKEFFFRFFEDSIEKTEGNFSRLGLWKRMNDLRRVATILFDNALYLNNIRSLEDIHNLLWKINREVLDEDPYAEEPAWGFTIHHTTHPIYLHNYLLGDLTCDMLEDVFCIRESIDEVSEKPGVFGKFILDEVIGVSGRFPFPELFKRISGEELTLRFLTDRFKREVTRIM